MCRREEKEVKRGPCCLPELGCLATYIDHVPRALIHLTAEIWERKCQTPIFENLFFLQMYFLMATNIPALYRVCGVQVYEVSPLQVEMLNAGLALSWQASI
jgi:hypothetical protein